MQCGSAEISRQMSNSSHKMVTPGGVVLYTDHLQCMWLRLVFCDLVSMQRPSLPRVADGMYVAFAICLLLLAGLMCEWKVVVCLS